MATEPGSGITNRDIMKKLCSLNLSKYKNALIKAKFPTRKIDAMAIGFEDGQLSMIMHLQEMGIIKILE